MSKPLRGLATAPVARKIYFPTRDNIIPSTGTSWASTPPEIEAMVAEFLLQDFVKDRSLDTRSGLEPLYALGRDMTLLVLKRALKSIETDEDEIKVRLQSYDIHVKKFRDRDHRVLGKKPVLQYPVFITINKKTRRSGLCYIYYSDARKAWAEEFGKNRDERRDVENDYEDMIGRKMVIERALRILDEQARQRETPSSLSTSSS